MRIIGSLLVLLALLGDDVLCKTTSKHKGHHVHHKENVKKLSHKRYLHHSTKSVETGTGRSHVPKPHVELERTIYPTPSNMRALRAKLHRVLKFKGDVIKEGGFHGRSIHAQPTATMRATARMTVFDADSSDETPPVIDSSAPVIDSPTVSSDLPPNVVNSPPEMKTEDITVNENSKVDNISPTEDPNPEREILPVETSSYDNKVSQKDSESEYRMTTPSAITHADEPASDIPPQKPVVRNLTLNLYSSEDTETKEEHLKPISIKKKLHVEVQKKSQPPPVHIEYPKPIIIAFKKPDQNHLINNVTKLSQMNKIFLAPKALNMMKTPEVDRPLQVPDMHRALQLHHFKNISLQIPEVNKAFQHHFQTKSLQASDENKNEKGLLFTNPSPMIDDSLTNENKAEITRHNVKNEILDSTAADSSHYDDIDEIDQPSDQASNEVPSDEANQLQAEMNQRKSMDALTKQNNRAAAITRQNDKIADLVKENGVGDVSHTQPVKPNELPNKLVEHIFKTNEKMMKLSNSLFDGPNKQNTKPQGNDVNTGNMPGSLHGTNHIAPFSPGQFNIQSPANVAQFPASFSGQEYNGIQSSIPPQSNGLSSKGTLPQPEFPSQGSQSVGFQGLPTTNTLGDSLNSPGSRVSAENVYIQSPADIISYTKQVSPQQNLRNTADFQKQNINEKAPKQPYSTNKRVEEYQQVNKVLPGGMVSQQPYTMYPQRIPYTPNRQSNLNKPHGPSIAFIDTMFQDHKSSYVKTKTSTKATATGNAASLSTSQADAQINNEKSSSYSEKMAGLKGKVQDLRHNTARKQGSRNSYGWGQGQGFGYGRTSYGRGGGHAWAGDSYNTAPYGDYGQLPGNGGSKQTNSNSSPGEIPAQPQSATNAHQPSNPIQVQQQSESASQTAISPEVGTTPQYTSNFPRPVVVKQPSKQVKLSKDEEDTMDEIMEKTKAAPGKKIDQKIKNKEEKPKGKKFAEQATGSGYGTGFGNKESWGQGGGYAWAGKAPPQGAPNPADFMQKPASVPNFPQNNGAYSTGSGGYSNSGGVQSTGPASTNTARQPDTPQAAHQSQSSTGATQQSNFQDEDASDSELQNEEQIIESDQDSSHYGDQDSSSKNEDDEELVEEEEGDTNEATQNNDEINNEQDLDDQQQQEIEEPQPQQKQQQQNQQQKLQQKQQNKKIVQQRKQQPKQQSELQKQPLTQPKSNQQKPQNQPQQASKYDIDD